MKNVVRALRCAVAVAAVTLVPFFGSEAFAGAVSGDLAIDGNTAVTFDPTTPTPVTVKFNDANLFGAQFFQVAARTQDAVNFALSSLMYSFDNVTYLNFASGSLITGSTPTYNYSNLVAIASTSADIYFKYEIPAGLEYSKVTQFALYANNDGVLDGSGVLLDDITNGYVNLVRTHTAIDAPAPVPEPATMTIALVGMGLAGAARLRKRFSKA